jgi:hypothetical protein
MLSASRCRCPNGVTGYLKLMAHQGLTQMASRARLRPGRRLSVLHGLA